MKHVKYGRKIFALKDGTTELVRISLTEKPRVGEDEEAFTRRLIRKYGDQEATIELVIKNNRPDYAIITFS